MSILAGRERQHLMGRLVWLERRIAAFETYLGTTPPETIASWLNMPPANVPDSFCNHPRQRWGRRWLPCATEGCPHGFERADLVIYKPPPVDGWNEPTLGNAGNFETFVLRRCLLVDKHGDEFGLWQFPKGAAK